MFELQKTCDACPEQYNVLYNGQQVGRLRLRHGNFTVECPDSGGELVYSASPNGDGLFDYKERDYYLSHALAAIEQWLCKR
jgi:hypothetical protein